MFAVGDSEYHKNSRVSRPVSQHTHAPDLAVVPDAHEAARGPLLRRGARHLDRKYAAGRVAVALVTQVLNHLSSSVSRER